MVLSEHVQSLTSWLETLDERTFADVLSRRPDVLTQPGPRTLPELAVMLEHPYSVVASLRESPLPVLQVTEAIQALGGRCRRERLTDLLTPEDEDGEGHERDVQAALTMLADRALVWEAPDGTLVAAAGLAGCHSQPLGLGPRLSQLLNAASADTLHLLLANLGRPRRKTKLLNCNDLENQLSDVAVVLGLLSSAPPAVATEMRRLANPSQYDFEFNSNDYADRMSAAQWGLQHGLLFGTPWSYQQMPAEVALILRGEDHRAPFTPRPIPPVTTVVSPVDVDRESAAQAAAFADHTLSVLDHLANHPLALLKSGGVGARELKRLVKATGADSTVVRLTLELAGQAGLLTSDGLSAGLGEDFESWRALEPGERFAALVSAWWLAGFIPTETSDDDGKAVPALLDGSPCEGCRRARVGLLCALAELAPGTATTRATFVPTALWGRPVVHLLPQDGDQTLATTWREAELLGLLAHGSLSSMGRALVAEDQAALTRGAAQALPGTTHQAVFGADLTVVVVGAPAAAVSRLLDSVADREGRGGAAVWRVTAGSLRRALDEGTTGEELGVALGDIAVGPLPQPLQYLIADVARRHGTVRVQDVAACVRSDDTPLLAEVAADRLLKALGLRHVAPTVLLSSVDAVTTIKALRTAGYLPVLENTDGTVVLSAGARTVLIADGEYGGYPLAILGREPSLAASPAPTVDPVALVAALRRAELES